MKSGFASFVKVPGTTAGFPQYGHSETAVVASTVTAAPQEEHVKERIPSRSSSFQEARERYAWMGSLALAETSFAAEIVSLVSTDAAPAASSPIRSKSLRSPASVRSVSLSACASAFCCLAA